MTNEDIGLTFAGYSVSEGLFKFRNCGDKKDFDRVRNILNGNIYFSTCDQLNDPFEFRFQLRHEPKEGRRLAGFQRAMRDSKVIGKMPPAKRLEKARQMSNKIADNNR